MQTTAIRTVANSLPENKVILLTLLISSRYIPYTDLGKKFYLPRVQSLMSAQWYHMLRISELETCDIRREMISL